MATLQQIMDQDLEPDPGGGGKKIREGVAANRRVSVANAEMRHGRKSKTRRFNGFRRHIATDLGFGADALRRDHVGELGGGRGGGRTGRRHSRCRAGDRCALHRPQLREGGDEVLGRGRGIVCRPWITRNKGTFLKAALKINMRDLTFTCPGEVERIAFGLRDTALRPQCTAATLGAGRSVNVTADERLQQRLRKYFATPRGRARLRRAQARSPRPPPRRAQEPLRPTTQPLPSRTSRPPSCRVSKRYQRHDAPRRALSQNSRAEFTPPPLRSCGKTYYTPYTYSVNLMKVHVARRAKLGTAKRKAIARRVGR